MNLAFTICANNYLAHANVLAQSYKKHHAESKFVIVILDQPNENVTYNKLDADEVLWAHELFPSLINKLKDTYGIAELCTVVKPELFLHFYAIGFNTVLYIDPDIKVYSTFIEVFEMLKSDDMVLTPHICSPTGDVGHPLDKDLMRTGIYNLGFLAMNNSPQTLAFTKWWDKRVKAYGYHDLQKGYFYDQIWLGYAPAFLEKVYVLRHLGYNVANWNLHERTLGFIKGFFNVNTLIPLRFFHFSHFKVEKLPEIASYNKNYNLNNRPDIQLIYEAYIEDLNNNNYKSYKLIPYFYGKNENIETHSKLENNRFYKSLYFIKRSLRMFLLGY